MDNLLSFDIKSTLSDFGEFFNQKSSRTGVFRNNSGPPPERRSTISNMMPCSYQNFRMRNLSGGSSGSTTSGSSSSSLNQLDNQLGFPLEISFSSNSSIPASRESSSHRKLDRSWSDTDSERVGSQKSVNSSRYKTELCRPFEESGSCKYGDKCQFAHGYHELRNLTRHPKYKTELCRTFHTVGFCPYGPRCHFIHEDDTKPAGDSSPKLGRAGSIPSSSGSSSPSLSPSNSNDFNVFTYQPEVTAQMTSQHLNGLSIKNINSNYDLRDLERHFSGLRVNNGSTSDNSSIYNNNHKKPQERDIFSEITMFSCDDLIDNVPTDISRSIKLDNFSYMDNNCTPNYWQPSYQFDY